VLLSLLVCAAPARAQSGIMLSGAGPVNRAMGGVAEATAIEASGALYWNPATISGLDRSQMSYGVELAYPHQTLASNVAAGSLGPGTPAVPLAGSDRSDSGLLPLPAGGLVYKPEDSPWTMGMGISVAAALGVNYPASKFNPILTPQPPNGIGLGGVFSSLQVLEIAPALSYELTPRLSIGFGPALDLLQLQLDPAIVAPPSDAGGIGSATYPPGTHTRFHWGAGFDAGIYYAHEDGWRLGASVKSPRWFEPIRFESTNLLGAENNFTFNMELPLIASAGAAYAFEHLLVGADVRYIDYSSAQGFRQSGYDPDGAVRGLGWRSIWELALGAQYLLSERITLRAGYHFNQNPIDDLHVSFNVGSPQIIQHVASVGASYKVSDSFALSAAYLHGFQNSVTGPIVGPAGAIPGTSVTSTVSANSLLMGMTIWFGGASE
jgi:long-chain fatty acid transport protein